MKPFYESNSEGSGSGERSSAQLERRFMGRSRRSLLNSLVIPVTLLLAAACSGDSSGSHDNTDSDTSIQLDGEADTTPDAGVPDEGEPDESAPDANNPDEDAPDAINDNGDDIAEDVTPDSSEPDSDQRDWDSTDTGEPLDKPTIANTVLHDCETISEARTNSSARSCGISLSASEAQGGNYTTSPVIAGDYVVMVGHYKVESCDGSCLHHSHIHGLHVDTHELVELVEGAGPAEGTPQIQGNYLYHASTGSDVMRIFDIRTFEDVSAFDYDSSATGMVGAIETGMDSSGVLINHGEPLFYFGTYNTPAARSGNCNNNRDYPPNNANPYCGSLYAINQQGEIVHSMDVTEDNGSLPFRTWVGAGVASDGVGLFVGGAPSHWGPNSGINGDLEGDDDRDVTGACAVVKVDLDLDTILAVDDPGVDGCNLAREPYEDAVSGEIVLDDVNEALWVQWSGPVEIDEDGNAQTYVRRYDTDLNVLCTARFQYTPRGGQRGPLTWEDVNYSPAGYYMAPTVDADGTAYVLFQNMGNTPIDTTIYSVTDTGGEDCEVQELITRQGRALHSPTLVSTSEGEYVLFAVDSKLLFVARDSGSVALEVPLAGDASVMGTPTLHEGEIYVFATDGSISWIEDPIVNGQPVDMYGDRGLAPWPRYRRTNSGNALLPIE